MVFGLRKKGERFTFTIENDLFGPLKAQAQKERRSAASLLNFLVAQYLEDKQGLKIEPSIQHGGDRKSEAKRKRSTAKKKEVLDEI